LKPFDLVTVDTIEEALRILAENLPDAVPVAGGTDLLVRMKQNLVSPRLLVDLSKITELNRIEMVDEGLLIGSMVTHAQIASSDLIRNHAPAVVASSSSVGSAQTRQLGTIGGNLVSCVPSLDSAPPLLVLNAFLTVANVGGRRRIARF
jgi:CO/xanthine dehydrogenase FAD-binding subunit